MQFVARHLLFLSLISYLITGCTHIPYFAKPIDAEQSASKLLQKSLNDPNFHAYLFKNGISQDAVPLQSWDLQLLHLTALYFHPDLTVVKERLALAEYSIQTASLKPAVGAGGNIGRSDRANGDINPMSYTLQIDIPFETTSKRAIKVEEAQHLAEAAQMDAAEIAWNLRNQIQLDLINYHEHQRNIALMQRDVNSYTQLASILQKRVDMGLGSSTELSQYQLALQKSQIQLRNLIAKTDSLTMKLSTDVGLSFVTFKAIPIAPINDIQTALDANSISVEQAERLQAEALINRIDIRRALARYAAAESKLKLEVAKQIPDITLSPSYAYEFGDRVWSLGISTLLNLLKQQPTFIQEAEQLRAIQGAQFEALQTAVIAQTQTTQVHYGIAQTNFIAAKEMHSAQLSYLQKIQKQFDAGLIDRLAFTQAQLSVQVAERDVTTAQFEVLRQQAQLEHIVQRPLTEAISITQLNPR
jgi:outer membrane protein TolC